MILYLIVETTKSGAKLIESCADLDEAISVAKGVVSDQADMHGIYPRIYPAPRPICVHCVRLKGDFTTELLCRHELGADGAWAVRS